MARTKRTLNEINREIAKLQAEADQIREAERAEVVAKIKEAVDFYGITATDIGFSASGARARKAKGSVRSKAGAATRVKYKDDTGRTWSGRGRKPQWFIDALAGGKTEAELRA